MTKTEHIEFLKSEIEGFWQTYISAAKAHKDIKVLSEAIQLRTRLEHANSAYCQSFEHNFAALPELKKVQMPVKNGCVDYEGYCKARAWQAVEFMLALQQSIDRSCNSRECEHQHLFEAA